MLNSLASHKQDFIKLSQYILDSLKVREDEKNQLNITLCFQKAKGCLKFNTIFLLQKGLKHRNSLINNLNKIKIYFYGR